MNPYLEHPRVWLGFHEQFVPAISQALNAQLGEGYIALVEEQIYIHEVDESAARYVGRSDIGVVREKGSRNADESAGVALASAPQRVVVPLAEPEGLSQVEIRTKDGDELVAVVEVLSPTNKKSGSHREQYLTKRAAVLNGDAHLIEIDLLRAGEPMPMKNSSRSSYRILVSRAQDRPEAGLWPIALGDPLPSIPVPLRGGDADVILDLQQILNHVYDAGAYRKVVYRNAIQPPLAPEDARWADSIIAREINS